MRVKLSGNNLQKLFEGVSEKNLTKKNVVPELNVSTRTFNDWERGKTTIPADSFSKLVSISGLREENLSPQFLADFWHIKDAARKGGYERMRLYGNLGTLEGRKKGGLVSIKKHKKGGNFKTLKSITIPRNSEKLAELLGILMGDGHLSEYQVSVTTNSKTDREHASFSCELIKELFNVSPTIKKKKNENTVNVVVSSKNLVKFLHSRGMPIGNKIQNQLSMPKWITKNNSYQRAFMRGLFDTDGSVYLDIHKRGRKTYKYLGWTVTSYADKLMAGLIEVLKKSGFSPTHRISQKSAYIRKQKDILRYFQEIGTSNPKHYKRYKKFIGGVPKRS